MKTQLKDGCYHSQLSVNPIEWKTKKAKVRKNWFIKYRFYDPNFKEPKQVMIKGMNAFKNLAERQGETQRLIDLELENLKNGFNPFHKEKSPINASLSFTEALNVAFTKLTVADITGRDIKAAISRFEKAAKALGWECLHISLISRKHIRLILDESSTSEDSFNKSRSYMMILLSMLCELELIPINFVKDIKKKKTVKKIRTVLTNAERKVVDAYLKEGFPEFHRFLHIFFHSGARISEMMRLRVADIDLDNSRFKLLLKKGSHYQEVWKMIKIIALPYWEEVLENSEKDQFVFSTGLKPGNVEIEPYQITKRWYRLVKKRLNIQADFYSLKHLHTTEVVEYLSDVEAAKHNSHSSTVMVNKVYDVNSGVRQNVRLNELKNAF